MRVVTFDGQKGSRVADCRFHDGLAAILKKTACATTQRGVKFGEERVGDSEGAMPGI